MTSFLALAFYDGYRSKRLPANLIQVNGIFVLFFKVSDEKKNKEKNFVKKNSENNNFFRKQKDSLIFYKQNYELYLTIYWTVILYFEFLSRLNVIILVRIHMKHLQILVFLFIPIGLVMVERRQHQHMITRIDWDFYRTYSI